MTEKVNCSSCGHQFDPAVAMQQDRSPCPECGSTGLSIELGIAEEVGIASSLSIAQGPADTERDAARRLSEAASDLTDLERPLPDIQRSTLLRAQRRLHYVFIELWALREAAIARGVESPTVDAAIDDDPGGLGLAHDVGNLAKHGILKHSRSGHKPAFGPVAGVQPGAGGDIDLKLVINWGGSEVDGLDLARRAVDAWHELLARWRIT